MNCFCIVPFTISTRPENICKILPETGKCLHNLGPPQLDYIAGPSNKMCPGPGITLGLIIQNCHKAIATQKRMIYLPNFLSRALLPLPAGCCSHWGLQACRWAPTLGIVIRQSHPSQPASGIMFPRCPGFTDTIQCHSLPPLSLSSGLSRQYSRDPPQHNSNPIKITTLTCGAIKDASLLSEIFWEERQLQRNEEKPETMCLNSSKSRQ